VVQGLSASYRVLHGPHTVISLTRRQLNFMPLSGNICDDSIRHSYLGALGITKLTGFFAPLRRTELYQRGNVGCRIRSRLTLKYLFNQPQPVYNPLICLVNAYPLFKFSAGVSLTSFNKDICCDNTIRHIIPRFRSPKFVLIYVRDDVLPTNFAEGWTTNVQVLGI
jgi:hypothetical protein